MQLFHRPVKARRPNGRRRAPHTGLITVTTFTPAAFLLVYSGRIDIRRLNMSRHQQQ